MSIYLIKDLKRDLEGHLGSRLEFAKGDVEKARDFMRAHAGELHFQEEHGAGYRGQHGEYVGLNSTHQVHLANVKGHLLRDLLGILQPKYFVSDENPVPQPVSGLRK